MARPAGRRNEIHETFIRHVADRGYDATNLGDIAQELGMSKGTIVHHFGTKAQMLRELEETYMLRQLGAVSRMWDRLKEPAERISALVMASVLLHELERDATVATQREVVQLASDPEMQQVRKLRRELQDLAREEVELGIADGTFRPVDPDLAVLQMFGSLQWMWVWFRPSGGTSASETASAFTELLLAGLLADRRSLPDLTDQAGTVATTVRACLTSSDSSSD